MTRCSDARRHSGFALTQRCVLRSQSPSQSSERARILTRFPQVGCRQAVMRAIVDQRGAQWSLGCGGIRDDTEYVRRWQRERRGGTFAVAPGAFYFLRETRSPPWRRCAKTGAMASRRRIQEHRRDSLLTGDMECTLFRLRRRGAGRRDDQCGACVGSANIGR